MNAQRMMSLEWFNNHVQIRTLKKGYSATIYWQGRSHIVEASTENDAKNGLWEYLVDEIGI